MASSCKYIGPQGLLTKYSPWALKYASISDLHTKIRVIVSSLKGKYSAPWGVRLQFMTQYLKGIVQVPYKSLSSSAASKESVFLSQPRHRWLGILKSAVSRPLAAFPGKMSDPQYYRSAILHLQLFGESSRSKSLWFMDIHYTMYLPISAALLQVVSRLAALVNCQGRDQYCLTSRKGLVSGRPGWWQNLGHRLSRPPDQL